VPEYDPAFVEYLFAELDRAEPGARGVRQLVRGSDGSALGWYVYLLRPGRRSEALQVAAKGRHVDRVFDQLLWHAYSHGSAALSGRLEPRLLEPVSARHCLLRPGPSSLVHSRDPEAVDAIRSGATLLSRLDGDWTPAPR
jgi:hypothetical protein